jgi:hypothetical protein
MITNKFQEMYLDWVNNFLTIEVFANYYHLTAKQAQFVINSGRQYHEESLKEVK